MPTPPTLVAFAGAEAAVASGAAVTTASVTWQSGDVIVVFAITPGATGGETLVTPTTTGSGISFGAAQQLHSSTGSDCGAGCWAAVATAGSSGTFSEAATHSASTRPKTIGVYVFRGAGGIGNSNLYQGATAAGCALTPTGADCSVAWCAGDWAAAAAQAGSPSPTSHGASSPGPTASPYIAQVSPDYTYYVAELDDQASAGSVSYGAAGSGTGPWTTIAIEIKSAAGGTLSYRATPAYGSGSLTVTKQAGTQAGDWIFIWLVDDTSPPKTAAITGFTEVHVTSGTGGDGSLLYRRADGTEGASFTITGGYSAATTRTVIATVAGGAATLDVVGTPNSPDQASTIPVSGITVAAAGEWVLWFAGANTSGASGNVAITAPPAFSTDGTPSSGTQIGVAMGHSASFGAGATGTQTGTIAAGVSAWGAGVMVALAQLGAPSSANAAAASAAAASAAPAAGAAAGWLYATADAQISGSWANLPGATGSTTGDYATWTDAGTGTSATLELSGFGGQAAIGSGATVNLVVLKIRHSESPADQIASVTAQAYLGTSPYGSPQPLTPSETVIEEQLQVPGLAYADLADLRVRVSATRTGNAYTTVLFFGDTHFGDSGDEGNPATLDADVRAVADTYSPDHWVFSGDMAITGFTQTQIDAWNAVFGDLHAVNLIEASTGNHDVDSGGSLTLFNNYWGAHGGTGGHWYSFDIAGWHGIILSANGVDAYPTSGSAQYTWLTGDLAANSAKPTFIVYHCPRWSIDVDYGNDSGTADVWSLFAANQQVEFVVSGSAHLYQRFYRQVAAGTRDDSTGVVQFVLPSSGLPYTTSNGTPRAQCAAYGDLNKDNYGCLVVRLYPDRYAWQVAKGTGSPAWPSSVGTDATAWNSQAVRVPV